MIIKRNRALKVQSKKLLRSDSEIWGELTRFWWFNHDLYELISNVGS